MNSIQRISPIEWWLDYCKIDEEPKKIEVQNVNSAIIDAIPSFNKEGFTLRTSECASDLIKQLFEHYVDDSTLVLTTNWEHPSVCECLVKCKNVLKIDITKPANAQEIYQECQKYKSVFCYMIGIANSFINETSQSTLCLVRHILNQLSKPSVFVLDDCQGFLIRARDWSMFDYIVTTAHAFMDIDLGIVFCRSPFRGLGNTEATEEYLCKVLQIKQRLNKIMLFNSCIQEFFADTDAEFIRPCSPIHAVVKVRMPNVVEKLRSIGINNRMFKINGHEFVNIDATSDMFEQNVGFRAFKYVFDSTGFVDQLENFKYIIKENASYRLTNSVLRLNN